MIPCVHAIKEKGDGCMRYCESCSKSELGTDDEILPVLIDDNMETHMCESCIDDAKNYIDIEVLEEA